MPPAPASVQKQTACNRDCPDACGIVATLDGDRVVRLQGDPDHPVTRGFLCHRTSRFLERQYSPDRITTPLIRRGDEFQPISWDEALGEVATKMLQIRGESGGAAILYYRCGGSMGIMKHVTDYFFARFGPVTVKSGDVCSGAGDEAQMRDFGDEDSHDLFDLLNSKTIILWGKNPFVSHVHLLPVLRQAKAAGTRLVLIDPIRHRTADLCDEFVQPRPGGDSALALAVARVLFERRQHDPEAATYCDQFDAFREMALARDLGELSRIADVPVEQIERLAADYAAGPAATVMGWGMQRRTHGSAAIRVIDALVSISGNLGVPGGGASFCFKRRGAFDFSFANAAEPAPRAIPEPLLGPGILEAEDPPIRMVWVAAANPVAMLPDSKAVSRALRTREFTVVVDSFLTDTARCAHLVLPTTTLLEDDDLLGAYGHHWLVESRPVVAPPSGVKSDYEIAAALAPRLGMNGEFSAEVDDWKRRLLARVADAGASLEDLRRGPVRNPLSDKVTFADRRFATASGRVNLIRDVPLEMPEPTPDYPLLLTAVSTEQAQASQWVDGADEGLLPARVHPAAAEGFQDGDRAIVQSEIGEMAVRVQLDDRQRRDLLLMPKGGWLADGRCANALVPARLTDAGQCAVYYDTPVRLVAVDE